MEIEGRGGVDGSGSSEDSCGVPFWLEGATTGGSWLSSLSTSCSFLCSSKRARLESVL